jgi:3-oxoadipate enol-lactonase
MPLATLPGGVRLHYARDYRVIRVDSRGFGQSPLPPPEFNYSMDSLAEDVARAHVIGDTVAGAIALTLTYRHPDRVHTVTCCQSTYKLRGVGCYMGYHDFVRDHSVEAWVRSQHPGHDAQDEWVIQEMSKTPAEAVMRSLRGFADVDLTDQLPHIQTPALVIQGATDEVRLARARKLVELLPTGHLAVIPGTARATQTAPERSVQAWREFVLQHHHGRSYAHA